MGQMDKSSHLHCCVSAGPVFLDTVGGFYSGVYLEQCAKFWLLSLMPRASFHLEAAAAWDGINIHPPSAFCTFYCLFLPLICFALDSQEWGKFPVQCNYVMRFCFPGAVSSITLISARRRTRYSHLKRVSGVFPAVV